MSIPDTFEEHQPTEMELMQKMEDEHLMLQRQVRIIQTDRQLRTQGVHPQFRRQEHLLRRLKKEYVNLVMDLKIARSGAHKKNDKRMKFDLKRSILQKMRLDNEFKGGTDLMDELSGLIQRNTKNVLQLRSLANANRGQLDERRSRSELRLSSMENKLEVAMLRFNAVQGENKEIRAQIEHMLQDRAIFNQSWLKMLNALGKGKKFLQDLFESSALAYDQRDEWCRKLRSVQEKGKMDQVLQVQEMRELQKSRDHSMKLHEFLAHKGVIRINKKEERKEIEEKQKKEEALETEIEHHYNVLEEIHKYTEKDEIDSIIDMFENAEQKNFSIYCLLTDVCAENETLKRDVMRIRRDIKDRRDWNEMMQSRREVKGQVLRDAVEMAKRTTDELSEKVAHHSQLLYDTMGKIVEIFSTLDCSLDPFKDLLGEKQPSLWGLNMTFSLITERIQELVQMVYFHERYLAKKEKGVARSKLKKYTVHMEAPEIWAPVPISLLVPPEPCSNCVEARWMSRVSETPEKPFNRAEALAASLDMRAEPAYTRSDTCHLLTECRLPRSRAQLAQRYM